MHTALTTLARLLPALAGAPGLPSVAAPWFEPVMEVAATDTARTRSRVKAIEYSGFYNVRRKIHKTMSYAMIPLFIGSYVSGDAILRNRNNPPKWATDLHKPFAMATGVVFTVNTVTGLWNLWDSRKDPNGQVKRTVHGLMFMAATAGFVYTGTSLAKSAKDRTDPSRFHRTVGMASMGVSVLSFGIMLVFK